MSADAVSIQLWLDLTLDSGDVVRLDVIRCAGNFALNSKPRCIMAMALGRQGDRPSVASPIHQILPLLRVKQKAKVWCKADNLGFPAASQQDLPSDPFVVFEGYTTGFGYHRGSSQVEYMLALEHFLGDLAHSSMISAQSSASNPANLIFDAISPRPEEGVAGATRLGGFTGVTLAENFLSAERIGEDFWGKSLLPFLRALTKFDTIVDVTNVVDVISDVANGPAGNQLAESALKRFEPLPTGAQTAALAALQALADSRGTSIQQLAVDALDGPPAFTAAVENLLATAGTTGDYDLGVPLDMDPAIYSGDLTRVAEQIETELGVRLEDLACTTMWDKMVQYTSTFMTAIVPLIDRALVVPFIPGLRQEYITIYGDDYDDVKLQGDMPRLLRGVGIYGGLRWAAGADVSGGVNEPGGQETDRENLHIGGYFQGAGSGLIMLKQAPGWLLPSPGDFESARASGGGGGLRGNALEPGVGVAAQGLSPSAQATRSATLMHAFAETMYVYETLKFREGDLSGRFRLDIAPGSIVRIEGAGEQFLGISDKFGSEIWATVLQVDFVLSADEQSPQAVTAFHLAHVRSKAENTSIGTSIARHPLWRTPWSGCPLLST